MFDQQKQFLQRMIEQGTWPHAVLFVGPDCAEKQAFLWWFVGQVLGVEHPQESSDVIMIAEDAEKTESGRTRALSVERVRDAIDRLTLAAYGEVKVAVISGAHLMTSAAQNALLKTLEEPLGHSLIVLSAEDEQSLLPTLRSRVMTVAVFGEVPSVALPSDVAIAHFLTGGVAQRFLLIQKVVKHDEGVAFVEMWLDALIAALHMELPLHWRMLDAALTARQKLSDNGNPSLLLESIALADV